QNSVIHFIRIGGRTHRLWASAEFGPTLIDVRQCQRRRRERRPNVLILPARSALVLCVPEPRVVLRSTIRNSSDPPEPVAARLSAPLGDIAPAMRLVALVLEPLATANTDRAKTRGR